MGIDRPLTEASGTIFRNCFRCSNNVPTPKRPPIQGYMSDSRLESLPMDLLVKIICNLHHDQLRAVLHVSKTISHAVVLARQSHFNYITPNRSHAATPPTDHLPCMGDGKGILKACPHTPPAPRKGSRLRSRLNFSDQALSYEDELCQAVARNKLR
ncbi:F-box protein At4g35930-like [Corylus avellana]|uniref:F-box protein At4g35930-like n=1 Tax=Corylus avellana TaxID=13451 RepID=UPI00286B9519|nr:F-box protein At4g35930-like [Corylus avellana]